MRRIVALFILLLSTAAHSADEPTVLVLGDSLSTGFGIDVDQSWTRLLQIRLETEGYEHRVVNASITGETTEGGAARIDQALENFDPALVIVELGGNDGLRGIPPQRMKQNLETIVTRSRSAGADVVMLGIRLPPNYGPRYIETFEGVFRDLAAELEVPWIEFFMQGVALNDDLMQADGIHPNAAAQSILLDNAWPIIKTTLVD